jgi:catechol-2,3-dioxygenase
MKIRRLDLWTSDLGAMAEFYEWLRPLELTAERLVLGVGDSVLSFRCDPRFEGIYHFAIDVQPRDFEEAHTHAQSLGIIADPDGRDRFQFETWNAEACYFRDPAGNIGEFIARRDRPEEPSNSPYLGLSEIGLATPDVAQVCTMLRSEAGLETYQGGTDEFAAIGDVWGLFIVVREGRIWFPEGKTAAQALPLKVDFESRGGSFSLSGPPWTLTAR